MDMEIFTFIYKTITKFNLECQPNLELQLSPETTLVELHLDSLKLVELIFELETHFNVDTDEKELLELETIKDIAQLIINANKNIIRA